MTQSRERGPRGGPEMQGAAFLVPTRVDNSIVGAVPLMSVKPWHRLRTDEGNLALVQVLATTPQPVIRFITRLGGHGDVLPSPRRPFCIGYNSKIEVWWRPDPQYVAYRVQRRRGSDGLWEQGVESTQPPFIDRKVDIGERYGYRIVGVTKDGHEGLRKFESEKPDLVILDVSMPKLNGWEVCERIRAVADTPVMMLTAQGREEDIIRGLDLGADDYLTKPFQVRVLLARIRAALRRARLSPEPESSVGWVCTRR